MRIAVAISLAVTVGMSGQLNAQKGDSPPPPNRPTTNPVGEYSGVEPGEGAPKGVRRQGKRPRVTWVGFQAGQGGSSRAFVQIDREVTYRQELRKGQLVLIIDGAVFADRNTRRRMDTRFFETAISHIRPTMRRKGGRAAEIAFHFKNPADAAEASLSQTTGKDGFTYVIAEFGPGSGNAEPAGQN